MADSLRKELGSSIIFRGCEVMKMPLHAYMPADARQLAVWTTDQIKSCKVEFIGTPEPTEIYFLCYFKPKKSGFFGIGSSSARKALPLSAVHAVQSGARSAVFRKARGVGVGLPNDTQCFSVLTAQRSLDFVCWSDEDCSGWVTGLQTLLSRLGAGYTRPSTAAGVGAAGGSGAAPRAGAADAAGGLRGAAPSPPATYSVSGGAEEEQREGGGEEGEGGGVHPPQQRAAGTAARAVPAGASFEGASRGGARAGGRAANSAAAAGGPGSLTAATAAAPPAARAAAADARAAGATWDAAARQRYWERTVFDQLGHGRDEELVLALEDGEGVSRDRGGIGAGV
jgi:hypothetical protein